MKKFLIIGLSIFLFCGLANAEVLERLITLYDGVDYAVELRNVREGQRISVEVTMEASESEANSVDIMIENNYREVATSKLRVRNETIEHFADVDGTWFVEFVAHSPRGGRVMFTYKITVETPSFWEQFVHKLFTE